MSKQSEFYYLNFRQCITSLEREIDPYLLGEFYRWADALFENAWSKALSRLENALRLVSDNKMSEHDFKVEQAIYFEKCKELLTHFKKYKKLDETDAFLKSFSKGANYDGIF